jgi:hypothetical protein
VTKYFWRAAYTAMYPIDDLLFKLAWGPSCVSILFDKIDGALPGKRPNIDFARVLRTFSQNSSSIIDDMFKRAYPETIRMVFRITSQEDWDYTVWLMANITSSDKAFNRVFYRTGFADSLDKYPVLLEVVFLQKTGYIERMIEHPIADELIVCYPPKR